MKKKDTKVIKAKAEIMKDVTVNQTVNLSLSQDDLVNMIIQEKLEALDSQRKSIETNIEVVTANIEQMFKAASKQLTEKLSVKFDKKFIEGFTITLTASYDYSTSPRCRVLLLDSTTSLKSKAHRNVICDDIISIELMYNGAGLSFDNKALDVLGISTFIKDNVKFNLDEFNKHLIKLNTELNKVHEEIVELTYNSKAMKAKLLKEILSQSDAGKEVLNLVKKVKGEKLLGAKA